MKFVISLLLASIPSSALPLALAQTEPHSPASGAARQAVAPPQLTQDLKEQAFDFVLKIIAERYYDRSFKGLNWQSIGAEYRPRALAANDSVAFHKTLDEMVKRLGDSHLSVAPPRTAGSSSLTDLGIELVGGGNRALVQAVEPNGPAAQAGIKPGDLILKIGGKSVANLAADHAAGAPSSRSGLAASQAWLAAHQAMRGEPGSEVEILVQGRGGTRTLRLKRANSPGHGRFSKPSFQLLDKRTGLLTISTFMLDPAPALAAMNAQCGACKKLIVDLRGNGGGELPLLQKLFTAIVATETPLGLMRTAEGVQTVSAPGGGAGAFAGSVIVLIDGRSASSAEVFAAAVQDSRRGTVIGTRSGGAVLLSYIEKLPTGGSMLFPAAEFRRATGKPLEAVGVIPQRIVVPTPQDLRAGRDAVLAAARRL